MSYWRDRARQRIAELTRDLRDDMTLSDRRRILWGKGYDAHLGTVWGRKMWGQEVRKYLARHGGDPVVKRNEPAFQFPADIAFPFREGTNAQ